MDRQPRCGLAGCRLYHADGSDAYAARRFQTLPLVLARRCGLGRLLRRAVDRHFYAEHAPDETWPCDWLSGCFLMVRREAIEQVGRFDEGYGKYFEDVDMCLADGPGGLAGHVPRGRVVLPPRKPRQPESSLGRRLASPPRLPPLAPQMGICVPPPAPVEAAVDCSTKDRSR